MGLFSRSKPEEKEYVSPPLEVKQFEDAPYARNTVAFPPKPEDLEKGSEWMKPVMIEVPTTSTEMVSTEITPPPPSLAWHTDPPTQPGLYWFTTLDSTDVQQCEIVQFGNRLSVINRRDDSCSYTDVIRLRRNWAGPIR